MPLDALLLDREEYRQFVQQAWTSFLQKQIRERTDITYGAASGLSFDSDRELHELLPRLVRSGTLLPVEINSSVPLPAWAEPAIVVETADEAASQFSDRLASLEQQLGAETFHWNQWKGVAWQWAQLVHWRYDASFNLTDEQLSQFNVVQASLDASFATWLKTNYASLAARALPIPHHLHHIPGWLAYRRQTNLNQRFVLLVLDGMALSDWLQIRSAWQMRHSRWQMDEQLVLAQIPSITAISRQALISGRRPARFATSLYDNRQEAQQWSAFWQEQGFSAEASGYAQLSTALGVAYPTVTDSRHTQALCLISPVIDQMLHGATQGAAAVQASLNVWLHAESDQQQRSTWLEGLIQHLLNIGYTVVITSDHGHIEALGMGQPREGVLVDSRSKRARLYTDTNIVPVVQMQFPETIVWHNDGLLPPNVQVLMPQGRRAFASKGTLVVSHGGITLDELVVPLITMTQSEKNG